MRKLRILIFGHDECEQPDLAKQVIKSAVGDDVLRYDETRVCTVAGATESRIKHEMLVRPPTLVYMFPGKDVALIDMVLLDFEYGGCSTWGVPPPVWEGDKTLTIPMYIGIHPYFALHTRVHSEATNEERMEHIRRLAAGSNGPELEARAKRMLARSMR